MRAFLIVLTLLGGCSSKEKKFNSELALGRCDEALLKLPQRDPLVKLTSTTENVASTALSYAFVGASYTAEVILDVTGGAVMVVALCAPIFIASSYSSDAPYPCLPGRVDALSSPPLGRQALRATKDMRCPNLKSLSQSVRSVAACFDNKGGSENKAKARQNLEALRGSKDFYECLPIEEQRLVEKQLNALVL